jgi:hypothetical protein
VSVGSQRITAKALQTGLRVELTLAEEVTLRTKGIINSKLEFA